MSRLFVLGALLALGCGGDQKAAPFDDARGQVEVGKAAERFSYPAGPYGATVGATIENFHFLGWKDPKTENYDTERLVDHSLAEFYDPDGSKGIHYLLVTSTAVWCSACKAEYQDMAAQRAKYAALGVTFLGALFEDNNSDPARPEDLANWATAYRVEFPFVLDPDLKLGSFFDRAATPMVMIVDTSTMQIEKLEEGWAASGPGSAWDFLDTHLAQ
ncbi:MAG TPA: TlpA disulfide reductase family protein [Polyangiaceae bacterium]|nr:TlpA disulfide reductase family protein [Polyangiaceae bacterium]